MIRVEVKGDKETAATFKRAAQKAPAAMLTAMRRIVLILERHVKKEKLTGQVLNVRTGKLRSSITHRVEQSGNETTGRVGTPVEYARIWELGGTIPAHTIVPKTAKVLRFVIQGRVVFCKRVEQPSRRVGARPYLKPSVEENRQRILRELGDAYKALIQ